MSSCAWAAIPRRTTPADSSGRSRRRRRGTRRSSPSIRASREPPRSPTSTRRSAPGTDIAFLHRDHPLRDRPPAASTRTTSSIHTNAPYIINEKYGFEDGLFTGFDEAKGEYDKTAWAYEADPKTKAYSVDPTHAEPALRLPAAEEARRPLHAGDGGEDLRHAQGHSSSRSPRSSPRPATRRGSAPSCTRWAGRSTRSACRSSAPAAMLQLLLGNVGRPGGGVNALRGHSNIQGATDMAGTFEILPGYLKTPTGAQQTLADVPREGARPTTLNKQAWASMNYWQNYPKFMVSLLKAAYGKAATKENDFGYAWLPKVDGNYSWMYIFDDMYRGSSHARRRQGARARGLHHLRHEPGRHRAELAEDDRRALQAEVAGRRRELRDRDRRPSGRRRRSTAGPTASKIQTEVFLLPGLRLRREGRHASPTPRAGCSGSGRRSIRRGRPRPTRRSSRASSSPCATSTGRRAAPLPEPVLNVDWTYTNPAAPDLARGAEGDQRQGARRHPPIPRTRRRSSSTAGQQLDGFGQLQDDGSTMCGNWLHSGVYTEAGNTGAAAQQRRPDRSRHVPPVGASRWPANRRIMYNRASADAERQAVGSDARRASSGTARSGSATCPTSSPTRRPGSSARSSCCPRASAGSSRRC